MEKIAVFWNINGSLAPPLDVSKIITDHVRGNNHALPVTIRAYGKPEDLGFEFRHAANSTGITLINVLGVGDDLDHAIEKRMITDLFFWTYDNPVSARLRVLKSSSLTPAFKDALEELRKLGYDVQFTTFPFEKTP